MDPQAPSPPELLDRLAALAVHDARRLRTRIERAASLRDAGERRATLARLAKEVDDAAAHVERRRAAVPPLAYPEDLPISARRDDILAALRNSQVVIVAGETGSGKSTQLPKLCLELGRGVRGLIGHTQPRRIAARTIAERVAEELGTPLGGAVGYTVRFTDTVGEDTLIRVMTDGILLAEIQRDRTLSRYDTIIVDEAHERSLNIDFLLGYLKQLLPRRPDLKLVITSATIDTERFSRHFDGAPVVEVSGRTYPVEVRYRPPDDDGDTDQVQGILDAVRELRAEGPGDILVFLSGEREIRDAADALGELRMPDTEILPLYARLSTAEQHRVFQPHRGRRVVLATNVAETSLTVPGIRYVVDPGTARISRYNRRTKVQRLPIEPISQAAANQRAGRCGRVAPGICVRLYSEEDFAARPTFTEPEILRTNLASVILQMTALGLGDVAAFPFVEPPDPRAVKDGVALLEELGALEVRRGARRLTDVGRRLAQLPLDPRLGRMVLEADRNGCVREVMVITAGLSIQDPRERPTGKEQAAAERHARFASADSDFLAYLKLWEYLRGQQRELSSSQFRKLCRSEYVNYLRVREWQDIYSQLRQVAAGVGIRLNRSPGEPDSIHMSLLAGLLSHVGMRDQARQEYRGAHNARFAIAPGSVLFKRSPRWVMAAELVETNRLWGRVAARIRPEWAERAGEHVVKRSYGDPAWDPERGLATTEERVTLYGLPIVAGRRVPYSRVDPEGARELFLRNALVDNDWESPHAFLRDNRQRIEDVRVLEHRARRELLVGDDALFDFFDERVPDDVTSGRHFDAWWRRTRPTHPDLLRYTFDLLVDPGARDVDPRAFPDVWRQGDLALPLSYRFAPGAEDDGVTVHVPLAVLPRLDAADFAWHVPGHRLALVETLLRSLPKPVRREIVPVADTARAVLERIGPEDGTLLEALEWALAEVAGIVIPEGSWDLDDLPPYLLMRFRIEDDRGRAVATGRDLDVLAVRLRRDARAALARALAGVERTGLRTWELDALPRRVTGEAANQPVVGYPALVDEGETVGVRVLTDEGDQERAMRTGTRRLLLLTVRPSPKALERLLPADTRLALARAPHRSVAELIDDCIGAAVDRLLDDAGGPVWDAAGFEALEHRVRDAVVDETLRIVVLVGRIVTAAGRVETRLERITAPALLPTVVDVTGQLARLVGPGFVTTTGARRLPHVLRYLEAAERRLAKLPDDPLRDRRQMRRVQALERAYDAVLASLPEGAGGDEAGEIKWMLEELRVSLFAQALGTPYRVSEERIERAIATLRGRR